MFAQQWTFLGERNFNPGCSCCLTWGTSFSLFHLFLNFEQNLCLLFSGTFFFPLGFARNCSVIGLVHLLLCPSMSIVLFFQVSNLHFCCCESRVLMEILLTVSVSLTSQLWITLTSKITRFRWRILLFLSSAFSFYNSKFFIWLAPFFFSSLPWFKLEFQTITGCWCRWNQISILKGTLLRKAKSLQIPSRLLSCGTKLGGALKEQFLSEGPQRMTY